MISKIWQNEVESTDSWNTHTCKKKQAEIKMITTSSSFSNCSERWLISTLYAIISAASRNTDWPLKGGWTWTLWACVQQLLIREDGCKFHLKTQLEPHSITCSWMIDFISDLAHSLSVPQFQNNLIDQLSQAETQCLKGANLNLTESLCMN